METQALGVSCAQNTELDEPLRFGVSTPGGFLGAGELQAVADAVGRRAEMVMAFEDFFATPPIAELAVVKYCGADPIITWEPWCWTDDRSPAVVQSVLSGALDDYASRWADEIRDWASTVYVRFAHEFNGDWYPWTPTFGTSARAYVEAWRRLHDIFADRGAGNVNWVWAPSAIGASNFRDWYPGDDYVDVLGIDGYNWGASHRSTRWAAPEELFGDPLDALRAVSADKPILISEVGCAESGGCKADWIARFMQLVVDARDVMGFVWFEHEKETDWRIASTPESAAAMAKALHEARFSRTGGR
jgi:mannan endo-1,4-beta-mannosidase